MAQTADRNGAPRYVLKFGVTAFVLISATLVLVLFVLPQRYVLSSGFRESGISFPSPSTPFSPLPVVSVAARRLPAPPPPDVSPGPAELFWKEVTPDLRAQRYEAVLPAFERYLREHPNDLDVRHEYAISLLAAGRPARAIPVLREVVDARDDPDDRLLLARTLRELGRTSEASVEYATLMDASPDDGALALEWAQAHAWAREYDRADSILRRAIELDPGSVPLRVELARDYFALGRLQDASGALAGIDDTSLANADGVALRDDIRAALFVPTPEIPPPTLAEQAASARVAGDFPRSKALFEEALEESPDDASVWQAYANLLEYELGDFEGARTALLEVERLSEPLTPDLEYRLAQIEIWTNRNDDARRRLQALLTSLEGRGTSPATEGSTPAEEAVTVADVHALLGDLDRWDGDRIRAARQYQTALDTDASNERTLDGLSSLQDEVDRQMVELEQPRVGGAASSVADTDDFYRVDAGGEWVSLDGPWIWDGSGGNRWLGGLGLDGSTVDRQGIYLGLESARWWRWGTVRTGIDFGAQRVRSTWDYSFGGSLAHRGSSGATAELRYEHGPAYPLTSTLQSALADVVQDRVTVTRARSLGGRWSLAAAVDAAWLRAAPDSVVPGTEPGTGRLQAALSVGRALSRSVTLGMSARALGFTRSAPLAALPGGGTLPLFWDPSSVFSVGPYAQLGRNLSPSWKLTARLTPGLALIDERRSAPGYELVPDISAEAGVHREGERFQTSLDLFYSQGRLSGYHTYGARLTLSARDLSALGGGR